MSGTQGRFPPPPMPQRQWRQQGENDRVAAHAHGGQQGWPAQPAYPHQAAEPAWAPGPPEPFPPMPQPGPPPQPGYAPAPRGQPPAMPPGYGHLAQPNPREPDPAAYDLGSYAIPGPHTGRGSRQGAMQDAGGQWGSHPADPYAYPAQSQSGGYDADYGYQQSGAGLHPDQQDYAHDEGEYDEPPRHSRRWLIVGALVGSIGLGGGMAYAYKHFLAPKSGDQAQVVRAPREPARVAPADRGGKQFANTESKLMNRLPTDGAASAGGGETDSTGVRRVPTIPVGRDMAPAASPGTTAQSAVPGMTIVGGSNLPMAGAGMGGPPPGFQASPPGFQAPPPPAKMAAAPPPPPPAAPAPRQPVAKAPPAEPEAAAPVTRGMAARPAAGAPAAEKPKPTGYVAVLGYQRSQLEAMKMMADMQQKYDVLRDRKLEIVQSDETARGLGVIYRVVVGPRGAIAAAREVCTQLLQAGMPPKSCYTLGN